MVQGKVILKGIPDREVLHRTDFMSSRLSSSLVQSLRFTLQKIDEDFPARENQPVVAELKRLLLLRIAELESAERDKSNSIDEPDGVESAPVVWVRLRPD